jgi:signal transduction histidine kinase
VSRSRQDRVERFDIVLVGTAFALACATALMLVVPSMRARIVAPGLDLVLDSGALVVTASITVLAWIRYRERAEPIALYQCAAFLVLAIANARAVLVTIGPDLRATLSVSEPGQEQLYVFTAARALTAALLVLGGIDSLRGRRTSRPRLTIAASAVLMIVAIGGLQLASASLPDLIAPAAPAATQPEGAAPTMTGIGAAIQVLVALLFAAAAMICRRLWRRDRSIADAYVTFGLVLAAFAQVHGAISPSTHPGPVASGDLLRLGFYITLLLAIEAEARSVLAALWRANQTLERLHQSEIERAALEERAWLSRELHDGLAQDLWLAKLKVGRLSGLDLPPDARRLVDEVGGAIDLGLAEARQAVMALRIAAESEDTFADLMTRYVDDFEDRFGLRVEFDGGVDLPPLPVRTQAELLRIAQEALANAHHHADATVVRVRATAEGGSFRLSVVDNGRGFDPVAAHPQAFGLIAMRERAALIGADLKVTSAPGDGTRILVTAPLTFATVGSEAR